MAILRYQNNILLFDLVFVNVLNTNAIVTVVMLCYSVDYLKVGPLQYEA